jgi:hypothetical protein
MSSELSQPSPAEHRFAWDGFEFVVPADWNLSFYDFSNSASRVVRLEDDVGIRLQMEWCRPQAAVGLDRIQSRFKELGGQVETMAESQSAVEGLPAGWTGLIYVMPDKRRLAVAFWLAPAGRFFVFFRLHFDGEGSRQAAQVLRRLATSFRLQTEPAIAWRCYDLNLELPADFRLAETAFQAGRKYMLFDWHLRRFFFWQFSLADHVLARKPDLVDWAADFLNHCKFIRGPRFFKEGGRLQNQRRAQFPLGHYDEIGRLCFQWWTRVWHDPDENWIRLMVFNYRRPSDLDLLPSSVRGGA